MNIFEVYEKRVGRIEQNAVLYAPNNVLIATDDWMDDDAISQKRHMILNLISKQMDELTLAHPKYSVDQICFLLAREWDTFKFYWKRPDGEVVEINDEEY